MEKKVHLIIRSMFLRLLILAGLIAAASGIGYFFRHLGFPETNIVIVYLLAVLIAACFSDGYLLGILGSVAGTLAYNYFFTEPFFSMSVHDPSYLITFMVMTITALVASTMTSRVRQSALIAKARERESQALYDLSRNLTEAGSLEDISSIGVRYISKSFGCEAACICFEEEQGQTYFQLKLDGIRKRQISQELERKKQAFLASRSIFEQGKEYWEWPIYGQTDVLGIMKIPSSTADEMRDSQMRLLGSMVESIALAMDRLRAAYRQMKAHEEAVQERYRGNLLRAISHDLRTPLSGIIGTSEMLMDMTGADDPCHTMAEGIHKDADWLHSLVENILNLTRLQDGKLTICKEPEAVEEIIGGAVAHIAKRYPQREITVEVPTELLLVPMDARLVQQVLVNLLDNGVKHTRDSEEITVSVRTDETGKFAEFKVEDRGEGIPKKDAEEIFQAFYTSRGKMPDAQRGVGLGLTICEAIVNAHGGTISARNRTDGSGAVFTFKLPL